MFLPILINIKNAQVIVTLFLQAYVYKYDLMKFVKNNIFSWLVPIMILKYHKK